MAKTNYKCPECRTPLHTSVIKDFSGSEGAIVSTVAAFACECCGTKHRAEHIIRRAKEARAAHDRYMERVEKMARALLSTPDGWRQHNSDLISSAEKLIDDIDARSEKIWAGKQCQL